MQKPTKAEQIQAAKQLLKQQSLPKFPQTAIELNQLLERHALPDHQDIEEILNQDLSLTAEVIKTASQSRFSGLSTTPIHSIHDALDALGIVHLQELVISTALNHLIQNLAQAEIQEHAQDTANFCFQIAKQTKAFSPSGAYLLGLLHNVGAMVMANLDKEYEPLFFESLEHPYQSQRKELSQYGTTHSIVGAVLINHWKLPAIYARTTFIHHHSNLDLIEDSEQQTLVAILQMANFLVSELHFAPHLSKELLQQKRMTQNILKLNDEQLKTIRAQFFLK